MKAIVFDPRSSFIKGAAYYPDKEMLRLEMGQSWYYHYGITKQKFYRFRKAASRGKYFCTYIKGKYETCKRKVYRRNGNV